MSASANYYNTCWDWSSGIPERHTFFYAHHRKALEDSNLPLLLLPTAKVIFDGVMAYKLCWVSAEYIGAMLKQPKSRRCIVNHIEQLRASGIFIIEHKTSDELEYMKSQLWERREPGEPLYHNHPKGSVPKSKYDGPGDFNIYNINTQSPLWHGHGIDDTTLERIRQIADVQRLGRRSVYYSTIRTDPTSYTTYV